VTGGTPDLAKPEARRTTCLRAGEPVMISMNSHTR
jgi:hypothetical protein